MATNGASHDIYRKKSDDFLHHAGMLSEFLHYPDDLLEYVVTKCYRKIRRRLEDSLSKPYLDFLCDTASSSTRGSFPQFKNITPDSAEPTGMKEKQLKNDQKFFFHILPLLKPSLRTKLPHLHQALSEAEARNQPISAYNKDTYIEYHQLVWELLSRLKEYLDKLHRIKDANTDEFDDILNCVIAMGDALQTMAGGYVIMVHMKVITIDKPLHTASHFDMSPGTELDEEIYQIGNSFPAWKACWEWLKLMVVHFDAVHILISHMKKLRRYSPESKVIIKVISVPNPDTKLLPWKNLLRNRRYFDDKAPGPVPFGASSKDPSSEEIIAFLEMWQEKQSTESNTGVPVNDVIKLVQQFCKDATGIPNSESDFPRLQVDVIIEKMTDMSDCQSPGSSDVVDSLIAAMESFKLEGGWPAPTRLVNEILNDLRSLRDRAGFFRMLKALSFKVGTVHCEFSLGCFMMPESSKLPKEYQQIVNELSVSYIDTLILSFL